MSYRYLDKLCRVCERTHREHGDDEYDADGDCIAPRAEPSDLEILLRASLIKAREAKTEAYVETAPLRLVKP